MKSRPGKQLIKLAKLMLLSHCPDCWHPRSVPPKLDDGNCLSCHVFRTEGLRLLGARTIAKHASVLSENGMSTKIDLYIEGLTD